MTKTIRARFSKGRLVPLEELELEEGKEVTVTIFELPEMGMLDPLDISFGGWVGLIDAEKLKRDIYADRLISTRPEVKL